MVGLLQIFMALNRCNFFKYILDRYISIRYIIDTTYREPIYLEKKYKQWKG